MLIARRGRLFASLKFSTFPPREFDDPEMDPLHFPDSYLGLLDREGELVVDEELVKEYKCSPTVGDVKFIKAMTTILRNGAITWWEAAGVVKKYGVELRSFHVCEILKKNIDSDSAVGLFRWAEAQPGFKHDTRSYNRMLRTLGDDLNLKHLRLLLREMDARNVRRTYDTYMIVVMSYFNGAQVDKALETFFEFERNVRPKPKKKYYLIVIKRLIAFKRFNDVPVVTKSMLQHGHIPDTETMNEMVLQLAEFGSADEAINFSRMMIAKGCIPDVHTFMNLLVGFTKSGCYDKTSVAISDMRSAGFSPNPHNLNLLLEFLLGTQNPLETLEMVKEMIGAFGLNPEASLMLVRFFESEGDPRLVLGFYMDLAKHNVYPDLPGYISLLKMLNAYGLINEAVDIYHQMKGEGGCKPDRDAKNVILHVLSKAGMMKEALDVYHGMESSRKRNKQPNKVTYDILITGLALDDRVSDCLRIFRQMESDGFSPDRETYVRLITILSKAGMHEQAFKLFGRMKLEGLEPSKDMYNAILKKRRRDMEAERLKKLNP